MVRDFQCGDCGMQFGVRGAGLAMHRPSVDVIGIVRPVRSRFDMPVLCGGDVRVFARCDSTCFAMRSATALPPSTPSSPPSQNVGCTSTMINALPMVASYLVLRCFHGQHNQFRRQASGMICQKTIVFFFPLALRGYSRMRVTYSRLTASTLPSFSSTMPPSVTSLTVP